MRPRLLFPAFCLLAPAAAGAQDSSDYAAWTHEQKVRAAQPGLARLELEPALLDASRAAGGAPFHDLRLVSPAGVETPCVLVLPELARPPRVDAVDFKVTLHPGATVLQFRQAGVEVIEEVLLETTAPAFIKAATLAASSDGVTWQTLSGGEVLARQNGLERLRIPLSPAAWTHFRVTIDDSRSPPVVFDDARLKREVPELRTASQPVTIRAREETGGETRLTLDLGAANLMLGSVRLRTPEPVFQREAVILGKRRTLFRLSHDGHLGEDLEIPVQQIAPEREVKLVIRNGDSPPLAIEGVEATRHAVALIFHASMPGQWRLYIGNPQAAQPAYDIAAFQEQLRNASALPATASAVEANPAFRKSAAAPLVGEAEAGAPLDVSAWSFRRSVQFAEPGVIELELEPQVLAESASDLHDLRVVREGRQVPFLTIKPGTQRETEAPFTAAADPERPTWSQWEVELPFKGFPASELVLDAPALLFARDLEVIELRSTGQGTVPRTLGTAQWRRGPGQSVRPLVIGLYHTPQTGAIQIRTDNGDNPPLRLASVRLLHPVVRLMFRVPDTAAVHLCYGNPRAGYARYDMQLARSEFEKAIKVPAALGSEEKLPGHRGGEPARHAYGPGSVWVWLALAVVAGGLLWLVARLLPKA